MSEWDESDVVLPAPNDWPHWKLSRLIITPMAEPGSQPYVYSAVLWLQTHHSDWTRRRALATFYSGWDLGGNNNLGNRLSEVTDQHNAPKRTFVRLRLWCPLLNKTINDSHIIKTFHCWVLFLVNYNPMELRPTWIQDESGDNDCCSWNAVFLGY